MYLLTLMMVHLAVFAHAKDKTVKHDLAIITIDDGASLGDCIWSLTHENALGAQFLDSSAPHWDQKQGICTNNYADHCGEHFGYWQFQGCVLRFDAYYKLGHAPLEGQQFTNSNGHCIYKPYGDDAGSTFDYMAWCPCDQVGITTNC